MSAQQDPILARFAVPPNPGAEGPCLEVDRTTGLLHEPGATAPFVEELIAMGGLWRGDIGTATLLTEATDPTDPDIVRGDSPWLRAGGESVLTRMVDPADPDLVRGDSAWSRFSVSVATVLTKFNDPVDPDLVRGDSAWSKFSASVATTVTKASDDPYDPDLVRAEPLREFLDGIGE